MSAVESVIFSLLFFPFRGNNYIREAMHAVFSLSCHSRGMDKYRKPLLLVLYTDISSPISLERIEDVVLNRRSDAAERLIETAERRKAEAGSGQEFSL